MIQSFNPIQGKLTKMRSSKVINTSQKSDSTPIKAFHWETHLNSKENVNAFVMIDCSNSQCLDAKNDRYAHKLSILQKRNNQKKESNIFYKKQIMRRKQKHQKQLFDNQQKFEETLMKFQQQLINKMKKQNQIDEQKQQLENLILEAEGDRNLENMQRIIEKIDTSLLEQIQRKLHQKGVFGSQLLYSKETLNPMNNTLKKDFMTYSMQSNAISTYNKHHQQRNHKLELMRTSNDWNQNSKSFIEQSLLSDENRHNSFHNWGRKRFN